MKTNTKVQTAVCLLCEQLIVLNTVIPLVISPRHPLMCYNSMSECTTKEKKLIFLEKTSSYTNTHTFVCTFTGLLKEIFD